MGRVDKVNGESAAARDDREYRSALDASKAAARRSEYDRAAECMEAYARAFPGGRHFHAAEQRAVSLRSMLRSVDELDRAADRDAREGRFDAAIGKWKRAVLTDPTRSDLRRKIRAAEAELAEPPEPEEDDSTEGISPETPPPSMPEPPSALRQWLADRARVRRFGRVALFPALALAAAGGLWVWLWQDNAGHLREARAHAAAGRFDAAIRAYGGAREMSFLPAVPPMPPEWEPAAALQRETASAEARLRQARSDAEGAEGVILAPERWAKAESLAEAARLRTTGVAGAFDEAAAEYRACRAEAQGRTEEIAAALRALDAARAACEKAEAPGLAGASWTEATARAEAARVAWGRRSFAEARANALAARSSFETSLKEAQAAAAEQQAAARLREECAVLAEAARKVEAATYSPRAWEAAEHRRREGEATLEKKAFGAARVAFEAARASYEESRA
jgi:hypothetical protein